MKQSQRKPAHHEEQEGCGELLDWLDGVRVPAPPKVKLLEPAEHLASNFQLALLLGQNLYCIQDYKGLQQCQLTVRVYFEVDFSDESGYEGTLRIQD